MSEKNSMEIGSELRRRFLELGLFRPLREFRYETGQELTYKITAVENQNRASVRLRVEGFAGGGFAGQVYRVRLMEMSPGSGPVGSLAVNRVYAIKIFVPPSGLRRIFRNLLYRIGFQGPFPYQVNSDAVRAGAIWQKFIRRAAGDRFGGRNSVNDVQALFIDYRLGSCGEISDWVDGRNWRLEVDENLDMLKRFLSGKTVAADKLGSPEYRSKRKFMADFVRLLHDLGADEFARQYEWWTCKSQPNCLKKSDTEPHPQEGLVAVDFRAGLVLLPFLPMSPVDFKLILKGLFRGRMVQFDRGNLNKLECYLKNHPSVFRGMENLLNDLKKHENIYRNSVPHITGHGFRLLGSRKLWRTIFNSSRNGWRIRNLIDERFKGKLERSNLRTLFFYLLGVIPFLGRPLRKWWGHHEWRKHYHHLITLPSYFARAIKGKCLEKGIRWQQDGRLSPAKTLRIADSVGKCLVHTLLSIFPAGLHRFFSDAKYFRERLFTIFVRPLKLYFNEELREQWLMEMLAEGRERQILSHDDARMIQSQLKEPFIQKYLKSLAVHICTLPVTQIVSITVSWIYVNLHPELSTPQALAAVAAILVLFQITPISPGSMVRGLYVLFLVVRERNFKDYNIAIFLSFFKYIGYLAFPIQMTYRYPALARFMAGYWSTEAVHHIPVFGEKGALLEHWVFNLFYNWPLTIRRRLRKRTQMRAHLSPRYWHTVMIALFGALLLGLGDLWFLRVTGIPPGLKDSWWLVILVPFLSGVAVTLGSGGARWSGRIISALVCGILMGISYAVVSTFIDFSGSFPVGDMVRRGLWSLFGFSILVTAGALFTELWLPDPDLKKL